MANSNYDNIETNLIRRSACEDDVKKIVKFVNMISNESGYAVFAVDENNIRSQVKTGAVIVKRNKRIIAYIGSEFIGYSESMNPIVELRSACVLREYRKQGINMVNEIVLISKLRKKYSNAIIVSIKNKQGIIISRGTSLKKLNFKFYKYSSLSRFLKIKPIIKIGLNAALLKKIVRDEKRQLLIGIQTSESYMRLISSSSVLNSVLNFYWNMKRSLHTFSMGAYLKFLNLLYPKQKH